MSTTSTTGPARVGSPARSRSLLPDLAVGGAAATLVNAALWAGGRAGDVSFSVTPVGSDTSTEVGIVAIVLTTLVMFAIGAGLVTLAARRSGRWVRRVVVAAALVSIVSASGPLSTAEDMASGLLLAAMHLVTGAAFVAAVTRGRAR